MRLVSISFSVLLVMNVSCYSEKNDRSNPSQSEKKDQEKEAVSYEDLKLKSNKELVDYHQKNPDVRIPPEVAAKITDEDLAERGITREQFDKFLKSEGDQTVTFGLDSCDERVKGCGPGVGECESGWTCDPGPSGVCRKNCNDDSNCTGTGFGYKCKSGLCKPP